MEGTQNLFLSFLFDSISPLNNQFSVYSGWFVCGSSWTMHCIAGSNDQGHNIRIMQVMYLSSANVTKEVISSYPSICWVEWTFNCRQPADALLSTSSLVLDNEFVITSQLSLPAEVWKKVSSYWRHRKLQTINAGIGSGRNWFTW